MTPPEDGGEGWVLENPYLRVVIDPATGWLYSLLHKGSGLDPVHGATGPHLQVCADPTDTWGHRVVSYAWPGVEPEVTSIIVREDGPVRARLRVERRFDRSVIVEEFVLGHDDDQLRVDVELDWRQQAQAMKLRVPVALTDPQPRYEIPFATLERPLDGAEEPAQSWVDLTGRLGRGRGARAAGLTVINNAKHGYDASPAGDDVSASLGITAVRSAVYSWHDPRLIDEGEIHRYQDQGAQRFSLALVPHAGDWRTGRGDATGHELGQPVRAMLESFHAGPLPGRLSLADDQSGPVMITAIKGAEDGGGDDGPDLVVRAVETTGEAAEAVLHCPVAGRELTAPFGPYQIRTFRIPRSTRRRITEVDLIERPLEEPGPFETTRSTPPPAFTTEGLTMGPATTPAPTNAPPPKPNPPPCSNAPPEIPPTRHIRAVLAACRCGRDGSTDGYRARMVT